MGERRQRLLTDEDLKLLAEKVVEKMAEQTVSHHYKCILNPEDVENVKEISKILRSIKKKVLDGVVYGTVALILGVIYLMVSHGIWKK